jgi:hypothetical protein
MKPKRKEVTGLSAEAQAVWLRLDDQIKNDIQGDNPFKKSRNRAIHELNRGRGLPIRIIQEISGLSSSSIYRIINQDHDLANYGQQDLLDLARSFQAFMKALSEILAGRYRKGGEE